MKIKLKPGRSVVVVHNAWVRVSERELTSGNILLKNEGGLDRPEQSWLIYWRNTAGEWVRIGSASRPWRYGSSGQAKIGAAKMRKPIKIGA